MSDYFRLEGKKIVIIGGVGGIGQAIAQALAFYGAEVFITSNDMGELLQEKFEIKEAVKKDVFAYTVDVTNEDSIIALIDTIVAHHGKVDVLVNAQNYCQRCEVLDLPAELMLKMLDINVTGVVMCCKHFGRYMKEQGHGKIINVSSTQEISICGKGNAVYYAVKGAVDMLTKSLAFELGPEVLVNAITSANDYMELAVFLASDASGIMSGQLYSRT